MVIPRSVQQRPLVRTSRVLATCIAQSGRAINVFIDFSPNMCEVNDRSLHREVRNLVAMVYNTPLLRELNVGKGGVVRVTGAGLTKVNHRDVEPYLHKSHTAQLSQGRSQTVSSNFNLISWVDRLQSCDFTEDSVPNSVNTPVESGMHSAIALRPGVVFGGIGVNVHV